MFIVTGLNSGLVFSQQIYIEFFFHFLMFSILSTITKAGKTEQILYIIKSEWICNCLSLSLVKRSCTVLFSKVFVFAIGLSWDRQKCIEIMPIRPVNKLHCTLGFSKAFDKVLFEKILNKSSCHWVYRQVFL